MHTPMLSLENISKSYNNTTVLHPLSLQIDSGERIALIGPSGAGKSTLLNILSGTIQSDSGQCSISGLLIHALNRKQRSEMIGIIRQQFDLIGPLKVVHNVLAGHLGRWSFGKSIISLVFPRELSTAQNALQEMGIEDKIYERTDVLSGGEQQRVAMARLLIQNPKIILADEPVASLDPARSEQVLDRLVSMVDTHDQILISSLHSTELARKYFTRVIGLQNGHLILDKTVSELTDEDIKHLYDLESDAYA